MSCEIFLGPAPSFGTDAGVWHIRRAVWIFFFFLVSEAFIQKPAGERLVLTQLSFPK